METADRTKTREREIIITTIGIILSISVVVGFLLFIKTNADHSRPARTGNVAEAVVTE